MFWGFEGVISVVVIKINEARRGVFFFEMRGFCLERVKGVGDKARGVDVCGQSRV
jgi:hypothetical protein